MKIKRDVNTIFRQTEIKFLMFIVRKYPAWVIPDLLTYSSVFFAFMCGLCYYLAKYSPFFVLGSIIFILLNWIADGTDGNLARYRKIPKEKYGFYIDHICDAFTMFFIIMGLGLSEYMGMATACVLLGMIYLMAINVYLISYARGIMFLAYEGFGGTELKLITATISLLILLGRQKILGFELFDIIGWVVIIMMLRLLLVSINNNLIFLRKKDEKQVLFK